MKSEFSLSALVAFALLAFVFTVGFLVLAFRLKTEQVDGAAEYRRQMQAQSFRRVQTIGMRGRILDRRGVVLAGNRPVMNVTISPERTAPESAERKRTRKSPARSRRPPESSGANRTSTSTTSAAI